MAGHQDMKTIQMPSEMDVRASDGSEIRLLVTLKEASFCHCTLPPQRTSLAGMHNPLEEVWYCTHRQGQVWRKWQDDELEVDVYPAGCLTIQAPTHFQFRSTSWEPFYFVITTMPPC